MYSEKKFSAYVKYILKREMKKSVISVEQLALELKMDSQALHNKISRASFSSGFLLRALFLLGCKRLDLSDLEGYMNRLENKEYDDDEEE